MNGMLAAELAVLFQLDPIGIVLFVLHIVVIALFALGASKRNTRSRSSSHICNSFMVLAPCGSHRKITPRTAVPIYVITSKAAMSSDFFSLY